MKTQFISTLSMLCAGAIALTALPARADQVAAPEQDVAPAQNTAPPPDTVDSSATPTQTKPIKPKKPGRLSIRVRDGLVPFFGKPGCIKFPKRYRAGIRFAHKEASKLSGLLKTAKVPAAIVAQVQRLVSALAKLPKEPPHVLQGTLSSCGRHSGTDD